MTTYLVVHRAPRHRRNLAALMPDDLYLPGARLWRPALTIADHARRELAQLRAPAFHVGELVVLDDLRREAGWPQRNPAAWDIGWREFADAPLHAIDYAQDVIALIAAAQQSRGPRREAPCTSCRLVTETYERPHGEPRCVPCLCAAHPHDAFTVCPHCGWGIAARLEERP